MSRTPSLFLAVGLMVSLLVACQRGPKVETVVEEAPGEIVIVQTIRMKATVTAIDATQGTVTLKRKRRDAKTFKAAHADVDLRQLRVGDEVHAEVIEEVAVTLLPGGAPESAAAAGVYLRPQGAKPGMLLAATVEATATVVAVDAHEHSVTLEFIDGRIEEIQVDKKRDLSKVALGDSVRIQLSEALAISVVKP